MTTESLIHRTEPDSREDVVVSAVIAFVGALGVAIGLLAPDRTVEPALGLAMLVFVAATVVSDRRRRCMAARPPVVDD